MALLKLIHTLDVLERDVRMLARSNMVSLGQKHAVARATSSVCAVVNCWCAIALAVLVAVEEVIRFQPWSLIGTLKAG